MTDFSTRLAKKMGETQQMVALADEEFVAALSSDMPGERKRAYVLGMYHQGFLNGLKWAQEHLDPPPAPAPRLGRPAFAAGKIRAYLEAHPEAVRLSVRELAKRVGVSASAVNDYRTKRAVQK